MFFLNSKLYILSWYLLVRVEVVWIWAACVSVVALEEVSTALLERTKRSREMSEEERWQRSDESAERSHRLVLACRALEAARTASSRPVATSTTRCRNAQCELSESSADSGEGTHRGTRRRRSRCALVKGESPAYCRETPRPLQQTLFLDEASCRSRKQSTRRQSCPRTRRLYLFEQCVISLSFCLPLSLSLSLSLSVSALFAETTVW